MQTDAFTALARQDLDDQPQGKGNTGKGQSGKGTTK
jgi:hypothetical protein